MKKLLVVLLLVSNAVLAQPVMDGTFDGEGVWGTPKATADGLVGFIDAGANAKKLYVTFDEFYLYFGAEVRASDWMNWVFVINTKTGGGASDSWSRSIDYAHLNKPDYVVRGTFGGYAEVHSWNGSSWAGVGSSYNSSNFGDNIGAGPVDGWVEVRVLKTTIAELEGDVQFYITGNDNNHGSFDACPNDNNATSWNHSTSRIQLSNYQTAVPLPVELSSFSAALSGKSVVLNWRTETEVNNYGFDVERSSDKNSWSTVGFVSGNGNSNSPKQYSYTDNSVSDPGKYYYRLKQMDNDGTSEYSKALEVAFDQPLEYALGQNYPNPFNPTTAITFSVPEAGFVNLSVFDLLGQKIVELVNGTISPGTYTMDFDATTLQSGIYFYTMKAGSFTETRKMMLTK